MATKINYADKTIGDPLPASEFNQIKAAVNGDIDDLATHIADHTNPHQVNKTQVGLGNVDNTADINKPVSGPQQTAIAQGATGYRGFYKTTDAAPVSPSANQTYDLIGDGSGNGPSGTYTNLLTAPSTPLVIPTPAAGNGIFYAKTIYNGTFWVRDYQEKPLPTANTLNTDVVYTANLFDKTTYLDNSSIQGNDGGLILITTGSRSSFFVLDPAQTQLTVSGLQSLGSKAWRFENADGTLKTGPGINFAAFGTNPQTIAIPSGAARFRFVWKSPANDPSVGDTVMVNYGPTALPYVQFSFTYINSINSIPINPKPKPITADSDQTTDLPFVVLGADGFLRLLTNKFIYNPNNGLKITTALNINGQTLNGLKNATNDSEAVPFAQLNNIIAPINQAIGNQALIPIPDIMTDPDVPVIEPIATATAFPTASVVSWNTGIISIIGGALTQTGTGFPQSGYGTPKYASGANLLPPVTMEFTFVGSSFEMLCLGQGQAYRFLVDGLFVTKTFTRLSPTGTVYFQKVTFATSKKRRITIEGALGFSFGGIRFPAGSSVTASDRTATLTTFTVGSVTHYTSRMAAFPMAVFLGDSFTEPTGTTGQQGYAAIMGKSLGWNAIASGAGGTGYLNVGPGGRFKFGDRFANDVAAFNPDIIVIAGGINDGAQPTETFRTAARALFDQAKAVTSAKEVVIYSSFHNKGMQFTPTQQKLNDGVLQALAAEYGFTYINIGPLITGNGNAGAPNGSGNADIYTSADTTHPTDLGHTFLGTNGAALWIQGKNKFLSSGTPVRRMIDASDIDTTGLSNSDGQNLPTITAARVFTPPAVLDGKSFKVVNYNASGFAWTFAAGTVKDMTGAAITAIPNTSIVNLFGSSKSGVWIKE